ncbi:MAG: hypothetical protein CFE21_19700 [Bacteroidetes bacterium B1(2017)]|nr:MAG: hypothetical protein CFE21_19700 [Bacteroidetes bacterium B1(2017)]
MIFEAQIINFFKKNYPEYYGNSGTSNLLNSLINPDGVELPSEQRSIELLIDSENNVSAESVKFSNIKNISQRKFKELLLSSLIGYSSLNLMNLKEISGIGPLLTLILVIKNYTLKKFNSLDSKVLYVLYLLDSNVKLSDIKFKYFEIYQEAIPNDLLLNSLGLLVQYEVIRIDNDQIELIENISLYRF